MRNPFFPCCPWKLSIPDCAPPPTPSFLSIASPQAGIFGGLELPDWLTAILTLSAYTDLVQGAIAPAQYWKSPYQYGTVSPRPQSS